LLVFGVDFTSRPRAGKAITCASAEFVSRTLWVRAVERLETFTDFETLLQRPGPWIGGFDFPFSLPRPLVAQLGWPLQWRALMREIAGRSREQFRALLEAARQSRPAGARYLHRATDLPAASSSPMKLVNPPVGLMLYEGAPRLETSGVTVYPCAKGDPARIALEAYPALVARRVTRASYKTDAGAQQTPQRRRARAAIIEAVTWRAREFLGFDVRLPREVERAARADGSGDVLDAVLCACCAAWGAARKAKRYGVPPGADRLEGWIVGPMPGVRVPA
jgi:hypothetical protein